MKTKYPSKHIEISLKPIFRINSRLKGLTIADIHRISFYPRGGTRVEIKSISRWNKPLDQSIDPRPPRTRPSLLIFVFVKGLSPSFPSATSITFHRCFHQRIGRSYQSCVDVESRESISRLDSKRARRVVQGDGGAM